MPRANYGINHEITSMYNTELSEEECYLKETRFNNINGGSVKIVLQNEGRY